MVTGNLYLWSRRAWSWVFFFFFLANWLQNSNWSCCGRRNVMWPRVIGRWHFLSLPSAHTTAPAERAAPTWWTWHTCHAIVYGATWEERQTGPVVTTGTLLLFAQRQTWSMALVYTNNEANGEKHRCQLQNAQSVITSLYSKSFSVYAPSKKTGQWLG